MSTLVEQTRAVLAARDEAREALQELARRANSPQPGDAGRLADLSDLSDVPNLSAGDVDRADGGRLRFRPKASMTHELPKPPRA